MEMTQWECAIDEGDFWDPITEIEIVGLCTDICVISNALILRAMFRNVPITINSKCCAGVTPESHERALEAMKMCQIDVI
jgi:nicotinamidase-related amidase